MQKYVRTMALRCDAGSGGREAMERRSRELKQTHIPETESNRIEKFHFFPLLLPLTLSSAGLSLHFFFLFCLRRMCARCFVLFCTFTFDIRVSTLIVERVVCVCVLFCLRSFYSCSVLAFASACVCLKIFISCMHASPRCW